MENEAVKALREKYKWREVVVPQVWRPDEVGEEIIGKYGGRTLRNGQYGQYEVILVHVPDEGTYMLTGVRIVQLMDASMIELGHPVRVIWKGVKTTGSGYEMKDYEVLVADGEVVPVEALPEVQGCGRPEGVEVNVTIQ